MDNKNYITASCVISKNVVYKDQEIIFENAAMDVNGFLIGAYNHFEIKYPKFYKMDGLSKLGWLATELLLKGSFDAGKYPPEAVGVVLSNANASLDTDTRYYETAKDLASPALFVYTLPNIVIGEISIRHHFKGENAFFIFPAFDAEFMAQYVSNLFNNNILQCCICGWVDFLGDAYKTVLYLVEKNATRKNVLFTTENLNKIYQAENG